MWGLLAPTPPGRARKPCTGVGAGMPGFFGNSECAKIAKNLSPFMAAYFSLFCHGSARGGPHVPRPPLALGWRTASRPLERRGLLECAAMPTGLSMYTQLNTHPYPSVQTVMHSSGSQNRRQPPPAKPVHAEKHKPPAGGAHNKLSWSPSGDTSASPTRWRQYRAAIREFFQGEAEGVYDCTRPKQRPPERLAGASEIAAG